MKEIKITSNGIKQAIDDLVDENERLQDKVYKLEDIIKEVREEIIKYKEILEIGAEQNVFYIYLDSPIQKLEKLLEILDKEVN